VPKYLTVVLKLAENADSKLVFDQMDRINGATMSAASWSHALDEKNAYLRTLERIGGCGQRELCPECADLLDSTLKL